jgi:O-acetyl-ADP-ribose deacetylase (regulator of RNase III)
MSQWLRTGVLTGGVVLRITQGDLTEAQVDAIVNAANAHLQHGGGVAGAIARRGGPQIQVESNAWVQKHGPVPHHQPAYTTGGRLPCRYVIHAVGPVWGEGQEDEKLAQAVRGALALADQLELGSIAFPAISTGIFGFPKPRAARIIFDSIRSYFATNAGSHLRQVDLILLDDPTLQAFLAAWEEQNLDAAS